MNRREFIKKLTQGAAAVGGLAIGVTTLREPENNSLAKAIVDNDIKINIPNGLGSDFDIDKWNKHLTEYPILPSECFPPNSVDSDGKFEWTIDERFSVRNGYVDKNGNTIKND